MESPEIIADRRFKALTLRQAGASYREIAQSLRVSLDTAWCDVQTELVALRDATKALAEEVRELELRRLDDATSIATKKFRRGAVSAGFLLIKIQERRAKLLGLDAPVKNEHTGKGGGPIQLQPAVAQLERLSVDELQQMRALAAKAQTFPKDT